MLARPLVFIVAALSLGVALGLTTTMFSLVDAVVHPFVPFRDVGSLYRVWAQGGDKTRHPPTAYAHFLKLRAEAHFADGVAMAAPFAATVLVGETTRDVEAAVVSPNLFQVLGVAPSAGRDFVTDDGLHSDERQVLISDRLWQAIRGSRTSPVGEPIVINGAGYVVTGVMPVGVTYPFSQDVWIPIPAAAAADGRGISPVLALYRLKHGASEAQARTELDAIAGRVNAELGLGAKPLIYRTYGLGGNFFPYVYPIHFALGGATLLVLLIACANIAGLMHARGLARRQELAIRAALGASRGALARLVFAESAIIAAAGGIIGALLAVWGIAAASAALPWSVESLGLFLPRVSWRVFAFALAASTATVAIFGLAPALQAARTDPAEALKDGGGSTARRRRRRYSALLTAEVALTLVLLLGAVLLVQSARDMLAFDFGYSTGGLVVAYRPWQGSQTPEYYRDLLTRAAALPSVRAAALFHDRATLGYAVTGQGAHGGTTQRFYSRYRQVTAAYLRTLAVPIIRGRDFEDGDAEHGAVIVNQAAARLFWPLDDPVGGMVKLAAADSSAPWVTVVGVTSDVFESRPEDEGGQAPPAIYLVAKGDSNGHQDLVVRARTDPVMAAIELRRAIVALSPSAAGGTVIEPWRRGLDKRAELERFFAKLMAAFAAFGIALSALGVYGIVASAVAERSREFGVRLALGSGPWEIGRLALHDVVVVVLAGIGAGAIVALWAVRALRVLNPGFDRQQLVIPLLIAEIVLVTAALLASAPAVRRAIGTDPSRTLRAE